MWIMWEIHPLPVWQFHLDEVNRKGMLKKGDKLMLAGFGSGLTWGTMAIEWGSKFLLESRMNST